MNLVPGCAEALAHIKKIEAKEKARAAAVGKGIAGLLSAQRAEASELAAPSINDVYDDAVQRARNR